MSARDLLGPGTMSVLAKRRVLGAFALIASHLIARQGRADAPPPPAATEWYAAPMVVTDGASVALMVAVLMSADHGSKAAGSGLALAGLGTYLIGGPTVHLVRGRASTAVASLVLRAVTPVVVGFAGAI